jgi:prepilin-type N-terminal cleavage/methylation domain-containing protein
VHISDRGFTLVEAVVATALLAVVLVGLAQLLAIGIDNNLVARRQTTAMLLAEQKIEQLRSLTWSFDVAGAPVTDTALTPSPPQSLQEDTPGFVEFLDPDGTLVTGGGGIPSTAAYIRRWAIEPVGVNALVLQVLVRTAQGRTQSVTLVGAKSRRAP